MSRVNVDAVAFTDPRFVRLAHVLGLADADHARSKVEWLWLDCTSRGETSLPQWLVEQRLGPRGPEALIESELARWSRGRGDSKTRTLYIRGASERTAWLAKHREQSSKGGKVRASTSSRAAGRFTSQATSQVTSPPDTPPAPPPAPPEEREEGPAVPSPARVLAEAAVTEINRLRGSRYQADAESVLTACKALAKDKRTPEQVRAVIASKAGWVGDPKMGEHFKPSVLLRRSNFTKYLDELNAQPAPRTLRLALPEDDEPQLGHLLQLGTTP